jgi:hypothetical protein
MNVIKKILLIFFVTILLVQIPFIYRRYRFGQLKQKIAAEQKEPSQPSDYRDYKGIIHAHSSLGGHSTGHFDELVPAAKNNGLDFVVMTEHPSENFDTSASTLKGEVQGVLFVNGNEVSTADDDRFLLIPGSEKAYAEGWAKTPDFLRDEQSQGKLAFITYPDRFHSWDANYDGVEVFNLHTNSKRMNPLWFALDAFWSFSSAPDVVLASYFQRPEPELKKFDELAQKRKLALIAGSDAHSNIGIGLDTNSSDRLIGLKLDPYAVIFSLVRNHVLLPRSEPLTQENLLRALKNGNSYIGFDVLGDTTGFSFTAQNGANSGEKKTMGDEITLAENTTLNVTVPLRSRIAILHEGAGDNSGPEYFADEINVSYPVKAKGVYRVEVYLDSLGSPFDKTPWIISNPIYVR